MTPSRSAFRRSTLVFLILGALTSALVLAVACQPSARFPGTVRPLSIREALPPGMNTESYAKINQNPFLAALDNPLSTFSIDVDTASYANVRRFLNDGRLPPVDAVRLEELVNYFRYSDPPPTGDAPVAVRAETGPCPWAPDHRLVRIGLRARDLPAHAPPPPRNLTFLIDVSGSMADANKLPLVKRALALLVEQLTARDRVALVVYAGSSGVVLPPTSGADGRRILAALERLQAGGSTNGAEGIELAYQMAESSLIAGGVNRVVLATDGDFNVGVSSPAALERLIESKRDRGIYLSVLGFGMGNLKDATMESLADHGDGNYAYIDSLAEARKVLVEDVAGTLITVAKDVKVQVEMNPAEVQRYRLLGYENRLLHKEDFQDDRVDAGDLGAGQTVTALYEIEPARAPGATAPVPLPLRYQRPGALSPAAGNGELMTVKIRYKDTGEQKSHRASALLSWSVRDDGQTLDRTSDDFRFAAAVATFSLSLSASPHRGQANPALAAALARGTAARDPHRRELVALIGAAERLAKKAD